MADAGYRTANGTYVRNANQIPRKRRQICVRLPEELLERAERAAMDLSTRPPFTEVTVSDMLRRGLELAMAEIAEVERPKPCIFAMSATSENRSRCLTCGADTEAECQKR